MAKFYKKPSDRIRKESQSFERKPKEESAPEDAEGIRLNKYVAKSGLCSRRQAAELVKNGAIEVNGIVVKEPFYLVQEEDLVTHKGTALKPEKRLVYLLMNKPKDVITTASDERGRKTVIDLITPQVKERVFPVGRLDRATSGLLLLTNDGELAKKLAHPSHNVKKFYHVALDRPVSAQDIEAILAGVELDDGVAPVDGIDYIPNTGKKEVGLELHSGRNRVIRRIFEKLNYKVVRLDRTYYAGLTKKDLPRGRFRHLTEQEVVMLKHFT